MASKQLSEEQNDYLRSLPFSVEFYMSGKLIRMFHASPRSLYERIQPHASREERISMFENSELTENIEGKENQMSFATGCSPSVRSKFQRENVM